jgi:hypothetical protein
VPPAFASRPDVPADGIKMNFSGKKEVVFNHSTHTDSGCDACHHPVDGKGNFGKCSAGGCHHIAATADKSVNSYNLALHKKRGNKHETCVGCHEKTVGDDDKTRKKELAGCSKSKCHP